MRGPVATSSSPTSPPADRDRRSATVGPARFRVAESHENGALQLRGELDLAAVPELRDHVTRVGPRDGAAILDLSGIVFIDVAGLSALTALAREAQQDGWRLDLRYASLAVLQLAQLTSMDGLLPVV